jgi:hypothetical protein
MRWVENVARMREKKCIKTFGWETLKRRNRSEDVREDNIKMNNRKIRSEVVDWVHVAKDTDQWRTVVNTVMNARVP